MLRDLSDTQLVFNLVASGIIEQGGPSAEVITTDPGNNSTSVACRYRGPNGRKCAAGLLMSDDDYRPEFEGKSVFADKLDELFRPADKTVGWSTSPGREFLSRLQRAHDDAAEAALQYGRIDDDVFLTKWRQLMERVAHDFKLDTKALYI